jgi:DNA-directed RNA polymerase subunit RPC12/RpoP
MSVTLVCTACGTRLERDWIRSLGRGHALVCPHCSSQLIETGYVEVDEDEAQPAARGLDAGGPGERAA